MQTCPGRATIRLCTNLDKSVAPPLRTIVGGAEQNSLTQSTGETDLLRRIHAMRSIGFGAIRFGFCRNPDARRLYWR